MRVTMSMKPGPQDALTPPGHAFMVLQTAVGCPARGDGAARDRLGVGQGAWGLVSQAGTVLLWETLRVTGLARGLSAGLAGV
jgi:hypothetical protein